MSDGLQASIQSLKTFHQKYQISVLLKVTQAAPLLPESHLLPLSLELNIRKNLALGK